MATHSSILAWRIPCTEEPHRLQFTGSQELDMAYRLTIPVFTVGNSGTANEEIKTRGDANLHGCSPQRCLWGQLGRGSVCSLHVCVTYTVPSSRGSTQASNLGLLHCSQTLYQLSQQGCPVRYSSVFKFLIKWGHCQHSPQPFQMSYLPSLGHGLCIPMVPPRPEIGILGPEVSADRGGHICDGQQSFQPS